MKLHPLSLVLLLLPGCLSRELEQALADARERCTETSTAGSSSGSGTADMSSSTSGAASESGPGTETNEAGTTTEATTAEMTSAEATTAEPMPVCGNGVVEPWGPEPEECDDGDLDPIDGCDDTCAQDIRVFVSSTGSLGGEWMGVGLADAVCANLADDAGLPDPLLYRAWLSTSTVDARDRVLRGRGRIVLLNGIVVAESWEALLSGDMQHPIDATDKLEVYHGGVWTGTNPDGTLAQGSSQCEDWMTTDIDELGHYGDSDEATSEWTLSVDFDNPLVCAATLRIYCFAGVVSP